MRLILQHHTASESVIEKFLREVADNDAEGLKRIDILFDASKGTGQRPDALTLTLGRFADETPTHSSVVIDGSEGATVRLAPCCCPVPAGATRRCAA